MVELLIVEFFQSSVRSEIILCIKSQNDFNRYFKTKAFRILDISRVIRKFLLFYSFLKVARNKEFDLILNLLGILF